MFKTNTILVTVTFTEVINGKHLKYKKINIF